MSTPLTEKPNAEAISSSVAAGILINGHYASPPEDKDGKIWVRTCAKVQSDPATLYTLWRDVERAPEWQEQIVEVRKTGDRTSHWVMRSGNDTIEWDSEIVNDEPSKRIVWRSIGGDSANAGEVIFESALGERGTIVTVLQEFRMGKLASLWETITGRNPKQAVIENLRHFKALIETGEISRTQGQSSGPRGTVGEMKQSAYGEKTPTPPATRVAS
jgi:uncharacterized membrane protein